ncbi:tetratricopeptide repeat protein [Vibrio sp. NTOU-M3]|uniref:tetratricopeptide repeat protein n=1 Tax=unclassified Vibrio TaxID=2614977 RepID=UPI00349F1833
MRRLTLLLTILSNFAFASSVDELLPLAEKNDAVAQYELAELYRLGESTARSYQEAFYWYQQAAEQGHELATFELANLYFKGLGTEVDQTAGLYWLTTLAGQGNRKAQVAIATIYENSKTTPHALEMAELWYQVAAPYDEQAEAAYARILERKFNQRRAKQIAEIDQLDEAYAELDVKASSSASPMLTNSSALIGLACSLLLTLALSLLLWRKNNKLQQRLHFASNQSDSHSEQLETKIKEQTATIRQQKRQLETLFHQFKKLQSSKPATNQPSPEHNKLSLACAMFGFKANRLPDEKAIKTRFKQLSKIYHPDLKGSEEEMKRLNNALKIILHHVNK